jgi:hypothetical protein
VITGSRKIPGPDVINAMHRTTETMGAENKRKKSDTYPGSTEKGMVPLGVADLAEASQPVLVRDPLSDPGLEPAYVARARYEFPELQSSPSSAHVQTLENGSTPQTDREEV